MAAKTRLYVYIVRVGVHIKTTFFLLGTVTVAYSEYVVYVQTIWRVKSPPWYISTVFLASLIFNKRIFCEA
jgi:hypothetical protein